MAPFIPDDSFITFRYAENLTKGYGVTFNAGEKPVEGYSNFLWILLCAALSKCGLSLIDWTPKVGLLFGVLSLCALWLLFYRRALPPVLIALSLLIFSCSGPFALYAISGMETPLYVFLLLTALLCVDGIFSTGRSRWFLALACTGTLLAMCRPEGAVVFPGIAIYSFYFVRRNREAGAELFPLKKAFLTCCLFFGLLVSYHLWRIIYFGELLPTAFLVKGGHGKSLVTAVAINWRWYFVKLNRYFAPFGTYYLALLVLCAVFLFASSSRKKSAPVGSISFLLTVLYVALYLYFVDWMPGMRYHAALVGLCLVPAVSLAELEWRVYRGRILVVSTLCLAMVAFSLSAVGRLRWDAQRNEESTVKCLIPLGEWLRETMPSKSLLAIHDVGAVPYFSNLPTMDSNPQSLTDLYIAKNGFSADYFFSRNPDIAIFSSEHSLTQRQFFPHYKPLLRDPRFSRYYRLIGISQYDFTKRSFWVYVRRDVKVSAEQMKKFPPGLVSSETADGLTF